MWGKSASWFKVRSYAGIKELALEGVVVSLVQEEFKMIEVDPKPFKRDALPWMEHQPWVTSETLLLE
jgi:hypothetical protein